MWPHQSWEGAAEGPPNARRKNFVHACRRAVAAWLCSPGRPAAAWRVTPARAAGSVQSGPPLGGAAPAPLGAPDAAAADARVCRLSRTGGEASPPVTPVGSSGQAAAAPAAGPSAALS